MSKWIPVTERLPNPGETVVCRTQDRQLKFGWVMRRYEYSDGEVTTTHQWMGYPDGQLAVTHWFPLPPTPDVGLPLAPRDPPMCSTL